MASMKKPFVAITIIALLVLSIGAIYFNDIKLLETDNHSIDNIFFEVMENPYYGPVEETEINELIGLINNSVERKVIFSPSSGYKFGIRLEEDGRKFNILFNKDYVAYSKYFQEFDEEYDYYFYKLEKGSFEIIQTKVITLNEKYFELSR